jgi:hypothetical protein
LGGAHNNHDADFLTFHRFANFRRLTMADSVPMPERAKVRQEVGGLIMTGYGFEIARLDNGEPAFSNRTYVWENVPERFRGWRITRTAGGERAEINVQAQRDMTLHIATASSQTGMDALGWQKTDATFAYTDRGHTVMAIFSRVVKTGEEIVIPQGNWTGGLVLLAGEVGPRPY